MKRILILQVVLLGIFPAWAQRSPRDSRDASPTGMRNQKDPVKSDKKPPSTDWAKLSQLLDTTPDQLSQEYQKSRDVCDVHPNTYVALRLAHKEGELENEPTRVLTDMCQKKTDSFAFALKPKPTSSSSKNAMKASIKDSEKYFRKKVQEKLKEK